MISNKNTTEQIVQLGISFIENVTRKAETSETEQIKIAQAILCDITFLADQISQTSSEDKLPVFKTVSRVLDECVQALESSYNLGLVALAPEVAEHREAFQPEMA